MNKEQEDLWKDTRQAAIEHVLGIISESEWAKHLVIRGSVSMSVWYPDKARRPGDIDFVFQPHTVKIDDGQFNELFLFLQTEIRANPDLKDFQFIPDRVMTDSLWNYERADGRRIIIPWEREGLSSGMVQIDIVFGEQMIEPPVDIVVATINGRYQFLSANKELSLAWKILWLADMHPEGKDLYDAVLLAEDIMVDLSAETLGTVLENCEGNYTEDLADLFSMEPELFQWEHHAIELTNRLYMAISQQLSELGVSV